MELLTAYGAKVETRDDGKQAFEAFAASAGGYYDAVLMDIRIPVTNGYEAAGRIGPAAIHRPKLSIIAMTANVYLPRTSAAARNPGNGRHIAKPIDPDEAVSGAEGENGRGGLMEYGIEKRRGVLRRGCRAFGVLWRGWSFGAGSVYGDGIKRKQHFLENGGKTGRGETMV